MLRFFFFFFLTAVFPYLLSGFLRRVSSRRPMGRSERADSRAGAGDELVQDPNCLIYLSKKQAQQIKSDGVTNYFCSPGCASAFAKKTGD
jgi:YHS domain-containing protein